LHAPQGNQGDGKNPPGGPNNYQSSEPIADACLTEQKREMRTLTGRTTSMIQPLTKGHRKSETNCMQTFCSDIEKTTYAARLRKILSKTAAPLVYLQKPSGSWSDSSNEPLDLDAHFPKPTNRSSSRKKSRRGNRIRSPPIRQQHETAH